MSKNVQISTYQIPPQLQAEPAGPQSRKGTYDQWL